MAKDRNKKTSPQHFKNVRKLFSLVKELIIELIEKMEKLDPKDNIKQRIITSLFMLPIAVYAIFFSLNLFIFLLISIAILMTVEWLDMVRNMEEENRWRIVGFFYIAIPLYCVYKIRVSDINILFLMFAIIWVTDIFAFFAGKILGGAKLAPKISPNKTWSGLGGGVVASALIGFISSFMFPGSIVFFIVISILLSLIEQISDLTESKFKRIFGVKDSGNIIPGHGGVLDRLDGMMFVAPALLIIITFFGKNFGL